MLVQYVPTPVPYITHHLDDDLRARDSVLIYKIAFNDMLLNHSILVAGDSASYPEDSLQRSTIPSPITGQVDRGILLLARPT